MFNHLSWSDALLCFFYKCGKYCTVLYIRQNSKYNGSNDQNITKITVELTCTALKMPAGQLCLPIHKTEIDFGCLAHFPLVHANLQENMTVGQGRASELWILYVNIVCVSPPISLSVPLSVLPSHCVLTEFHAGARTCMCCRSILALEQIAQHPSINCMQWLAGTRLLEGSVCPWRQRECNTSRSGGQLPFVVRGPRICSSAA